MNGVTTPVRTVRWYRILADPGRLWVRYVPRSWPGPSQAWSDLARLRPGAAQRFDVGPIAPPPRAEAVPDAVWVPPVDAAYRPFREALLESLRDSGLPHLDHRLAEEAPKEARDELVLDLFGMLLRREDDGFATLPAGAWVLWPLVPGLTDSPGRVESGLGQLVRAGIRGVHGIALELDARQRRKFAEIGGDEVFTALFHGEHSSEREFARRVNAAGLEVFYPRPLPVASRPAGTRRLAGVLYRAGDLWRRLGRAGVQGEEILAAARRLDEIETDARRLVEEGNLDILDWLPARARSLLREFVDSGAPPELLAGLEREYLEADDR